MSASGSSSSASSSQGPSSSQARILALSLGMALLAVVLVNVYIEMIKRQQEVETFTVYRLREPLHPGDALRRQDVRAVEVPKRFSDAFSAALKPDELDVRAGETIRRFAPEGGLVTLRLFEHPDRSGFDQRIAEGKRLKALRVNDETVPGNLRPGMFVDLHAPLPGTSGGVRVLPIMERAKVMAVGRRTVVEEEQEGRTDAPQYRAITVEVTPEMATRLAAIARLAVGPFEVHLRNPADRDRPAIPKGGLNPEVVRLLEQRDMLPE